jgi:hypothetical protein
MTSIEQREWLGFLENELARRTARVEWEAAEGERHRQWFVATLQQVAERLAAPSHYPLDVADLSLVEKLALTLLPEPLRPAGLPTEAEIWAEFRAMREVDESPSR